MWRGEKKKGAVVGPRGGGRRESGGQQFDPEIATWILEFLIRQQHVPDRLINKLLLNGAVPIPTGLRLKRAILLRSLDSDLADGAVTETTLDALEALDRMGTVGSGRKLRAAYCAAAVECAVRYLSGRRRYLEAVERIWRVRVGGLEAAGSGLVGDELREWRDEIEAAVWDPAAGRRLVERNTRNEAVRLIGEYLEEALAEMGPTFLEVAARELKEREEEDGGNAGNVGPESDPVDDREAELCADASRPPEKEVQKTGLRRVKRSVCRRKRGAAIIVESEEEIGTATGSKYDTLPSAEVNKVKEALKSSTEELHKVVKDPLPSALNIAERLAAKMGERVPDPVANTSTYVAARDVPCHDRQGQSRDGKGVGASDPPVDQFAKACPEQVADAAIPSCSYRKDAPKQSLMERNSTAHAYKWEDSISESPDSTTRRSVRRCLDTPKNQAVSPLKKYEVVKFNRRRPRRKWSVEEEDALREAVQKYGKGNWKFILHSRLDVFFERTDGDLKDKWRNLTK